MSSPRRSSVSRQIGSSPRRSSSRRGSSPAVGSSQTSNALPRTTDRSSGPSEIRTIWATNVNVSETVASFRKFFQSFREAGSTDTKYERLLFQLKDSGKTDLNVDTNDIRNTDRTLYKQLVMYPQEMIPIMDVTLHQIFHTSWPDDEEVQDTRLQVRPFNLEKTHPMRDLDPEDIDTLVSITGMVIRTSGILPDLTVAFFRCAQCGTTEEVQLERGIIQEPTVCQFCNSKFSYRMVHNRSHYSDKQMIRLQESPDNIPEGETPHTVTLMVYNNLVDVAKPGDRVIITGVFRAIPTRVNPRVRTLRATYKTYIDVTHIQKVRPEMLISEDARAEPTSEYYTRFDELARTDERAQAQTTKLLELSQRPDIYECLARSLAPSIWELDDVKKGVLLQLFGGFDKELADKSGRDKTGRCRGELNVLLVGDPGVSKSQLLQCVHKIAPRGIYTSGKGSSAVGLTAYITKDPETKQVVLESGALVMSDRGICCIDEFDKMSDSTRAVLHEVMEQQTVSVAKSGIIATLNARTSVLASANPRNSRYDTNLSVTDNVDLPPTLLSRFDLIYLLIDKPNEAHDMRLARHIVGLYGGHQAPVVDNDTTISRSTLTEYISYAKKNIKPRLSDEAVKDLINGYTAMRKQGMSRKSISATPRQLESLIRLSEAHARCRFSQTVERLDVAEALRLMQVALMQAATNPLTGLIDMDSIATGMGAAKKALIGKASEELRKLLDGSERPTIPFQDALRAVQKQMAGDNLTAEVLLDALATLQEDGKIHTTGDPRKPLIRKLSG